MQIPVRGEGSLVSGRAVRVWRRTACPFLDLRSRTCRRLIEPPQVMCALCYFYFNFTAGPMLYYMLCAVLCCAVALQGKDAPQGESKQYIDSFYASLRRRKT